MKILYNLKRLGYISSQGTLFAIFALLVYSCTSLRDIGIQVAVSPEYPITSDIQSLALLNRSMNAQFTNVSSDSLEKILIGNHMLLYAVIQDSLAADTVIQVTAKSLFESGRFDVVVPKDRNVFRNDSNVIANPLNTNNIKDICNVFNVDAVLVLEGFAEQLSTKYWNANEGPENLTSAYEASTDITYQSEWRLYRPNELKTVIRFQVSDSIYWKNFSYSLEDLYSKMPRTKEALLNGGVASGLKMAGYISPKWVNQNRHYFLTGINEIDAAVPLINENRWEEATAIWTKFEANPSKKIRSKVEFNLALAAEMNGDIDLAIEWGLKSYHDKYLKVTEVYLKTLDNIRKVKQKDNKKEY
jgi:hypothetical protein